MTTDITHQYSVKKETDQNEVSVERLTSFDTIESIRSEWQSLHDVLMPGSVHADIDWYFTSVRLGPQPRTPLVFTFKKEGKLVGLIAGFCHNREVVLKIGYLKLGKFMSPAFSTSYHCCLALPYEALHKPMALALWKELLAQNIEIMYINALPNNDPLFTTLSHTPFSWGLSLAYPPARHMMMHLAPTLAETIANRGPSVRSAIHRTMKKNKNADKSEMFTMRIFTKVEELDTYFIEAETVAKKTYQRALHVGFEPSPFHRAQAEMSSKKGWFRGHILYDGNKAIAFQEDYLCNNHCFNPYVGYDPDYRDYNVGTMLLVKSWEEMSKMAKTIMYDFGFGEGVYKERLADTCICEEELLLFRKSFKNIIFYSILSVNNKVDKSIKIILTKLGFYDAIKKFWRKKKIGK